MKRRFITENRYLLIPVKTGAPVRTVSFYSEEKKVFEFEIPVAMTEGEYVWDFQAAVPTDGKKEITVEGDVPDRFLDAIVQADHRPAGGGRKPLIHFMPESGWLNDPCGLLYDQGVYHLYFQHNPFDVEWGNMTWGHAVSRDLLHWEQLDEALWPDEEGTVFTGSALTNAQGAYDLPRDAQLYVYTCAGGSSRWSAGKKFVQRLAWSSDGGRTLHREDGCILDHIAAENRDMKIYWHEEGQHYYAVLYLEGNEYAILNSRDLKNWEITQRLSLPEAWECPDLFELPAEDGGRKWVFWTADGYYFVGTFDGSHFEHDGIRREAYHTMLPYAAQTFNGTERVISVPWMRTDNAGTVRRGMMGMPRQLTLAVTEDGYTLRQRLTDEFERCKEKVLECSTAEQVTYRQKEDAAVELVLRPGPGASCEVDIYGTGTQVILREDSLTVRGAALRSNAVKKAVELGDKEQLEREDQDFRTLALRNCPEKISLLSDGEILEITVDDGLMSDAFETRADGKSGLIRVTSSGTVALEISEIV